VKPFPTRLILAFTMAIHALTLPSCKEKASKSVVREGTIEYHITYLQNETSQHPADQLPNKMVMKFKDNTSLSKIEGFFGFFHISNLSNQKRAINTSMIRLGNKKYLYHGKPGENACGFDRMENMVINYREGTVDVCGYPCKKAWITFTDHSLPEYEIYYTDRIQIRNPNSTNPYREITGVLLDFHLKMTNMVMHLVATRVSLEKIHDKDLVVPKGYSRISREDMEALISEILK
jgi:hypothetical protein